MANRKKRPAYWIFLALIPVVGGVAFFSLRALSRTPAKDRSGKTRSRGTNGPGALRGGHRQDPADHASGNQVEGQRHHPQAAGERWRRGPDGAGDLRAGPERPASQAAAGAGGPGRGRSAAQERAGRLRARQGGGCRSRRPVPEEGHGPGAHDVSGNAGAPDGARRCREELPDGGESPAAGDREPGCVRGRHRQVRGATSNRSARNSRKPKRTCATPPSSRPSMAWFSRATAKWATPSARF